MTKPSRHLGHPPPKSSPELGLVRTAKAIPVMERPKEGPESPARSQLDRCTGHCGHCEIHPCQLHTSV